MNIPNPYAQTVTYDRPHYRQGQQFTRYARRIRAAGVHAVKEEALKWSLQKNARSLVFPITPETTPAHDRGLSRLHAQGAMFAELSASLRCDEEDEWTELSVQAKTGERLPVGSVKGEDARWLQPLLREGLPLRFYVVKAEERSDRFPHEGAFEVAIEGVPAAARTFQDVIDARKEKARGQRFAQSFSRGTAYVQDGSAAYAGRDDNREAQQLQRQIDQLEIKANKRERAHLSCADLGRYIDSLKARLARMKERADRSKMDRVERPTVEDWIHSQPGCSVQESAETTCMTDLDSADYWEAYHAM